MSEPIVLPQLTEEMITELFQTRLPDIVKRRPDLQPQMLGYSLIYLPAS